ncbi:MAG: carboxypeptidase M32 [Defluviitaleaceae bacterium]|nr:carboxypeptidase M32 [Defluviitaleaceae bacterium]
MEQIVKDFQAFLEEMRMYGQAASIMSFDAQTVAPKASIGIRAKRSGFFSQKMFEMATGEKMKGFLDALKPYLGELDDVVTAQYRKAKKAYDDGTKIPATLVKEFSELKAKGNQAWEKARKDNDFDAFAPYLEQIVAKQKEVINYRIKDGQHPYDVVLDDFEEGMTIAIYDEFFAKLRETIVPLLKAIVNSDKKIDNAFMHEYVDIETQRKQAKFIAEKIGYDLDRGYLTEATHPFCSGSHRTDVRITTRYDENDFVSSFYSVLHECGHAIYEQSIGDDIAETALSRGTSMGIHESQSRFYENCIGRSRQFWQYITDELKGYLPESFANVVPEQFFEATNIVSPSLIRVEADELTYSLHIMIRYEIERMLFNGEIDVKDLPALWNKKYEEYLGITPPNNTLGVLQDIHWSWGLFGYFPTYALGSAYAAQFLAYIRKEMDVDALITKGDFAAITKWLNEKIHIHGSKYTPTQLMEKMGSEQLNADYYTNYLKNKYEAIYNVKI